MTVPRRRARVLLTAFDSYRDGKNIYRENASRLAIEQISREPPDGIDLATRVYPVDFATIRQRVERDLSPGFDLAIFTGQAPSSGSIRLETKARNRGRDPQGIFGLFPLALDGPEFLESTIDWAGVLGQSRNWAGRVALSHDAGDYLCNAALYLGLLAAQRRWNAGIGERPTRVGFVHVPLAEGQTQAGAPWMATEETARVVRELIEKAASVG